MKIFTHNFNQNSNSGPNKFSRDLFLNLQNQGSIELVDNQDEAVIEFCLIQQQFEKKNPMVLRLDGIYFNTSQDFKSQNAPIRKSYENSDAVIFQSKFNKLLTESWFGEHKNSFIVHNASSAKKPDTIFSLPDVDDKAEVWCCASNWRPHKRLIDNIRYFLNFSPNDSVLAVAGAGIGQHEIKEISDAIREYRNHRKNILILGELDYKTLLSLYSRSKKLIHLAYLDHCPNVVVDAQALGCEIVCSSTGGTKEVVFNGEIIEECTWDFKPLKLYEPPSIDFNNINVSRVNKEVDFSKIFENCKNSYKNIFESIA